MTILDDIARLIDDIGRTINDTLPSLPRTVSTSVNNALIPTNQLISDLSTRQIREVRNTATSTQNLVRLVQGAVNRRVDFQSNYTRTFLEQENRRTINHVNAARNDVITSVNNVGNQVIGIIGAVQSGLRNDLSIIARQNRDNNQTILNAIQASINAQRTDIGSVIGGLVQTVITTTGQIIASLIDTLGKIGVEANQTIRDVFGRIVDFIIEKINDFIGWYSSNVLPVRQEAEEKSFTPFDMIMEIVNGESFSYQELMNRTLDVREGTGLLSFGMFALLLLPNVFSAAGALFEPFADELRQQSYTLNPNTLLPITDLLRGFWRGTVSIETFADNMLRYGYGENELRQLLDTSNQILGVTEARELLLRGIIDDETHDNMLHQLGWLDNDIRHIKNLYSVLPPIQDIIRFAVREAFSDDAVNTFRLDEDAPELFFDAAAQQGLSRENALLYWRAHWELPGTRDAFEMFHRNIISENELNLLLRAKDIMPFWRDKLIKLSFNLPTRVDTRRMYHVGIWDRDKVKDTYLQLGYTEEVAEGLTVFTEIEYAPEDSDPTNNPKNITRSVIERGFLRNKLSENEAIDLLISIGYSRSSAELLLDIAAAKDSVNKAEKIKDALEARFEGMIIKLFQRGTISRGDAIDNMNTFGFTLEEAESILDLSIIEREFDIQDSVIKQLQQAYVERTIDETELVSIMASAGFTAAETNQLLPELGLLREIRTRKPSLSQLQRFLRKGIINLDQFGNELLGLGYHPQYVDMFIQDTLGN